MVSLAIKHCPGCVAGVWQQLQSMGFTEEFIKQTAEAEEANVTEDKKKKIEESGKDTAGIVPDFVAVEPVKAKAQHLRDLDVAIIRDRLLPHLEPGAL
eukprot:1024873-Amphidinium_carterae.1